MAGEEIPATGQGSNLFNQPLIVLILLYLLAVLSVVLVIFGFGFGFHILFLHLPLLDFFHLFLAHAGIEGILLH